MATSLPVLTFHAIDDSSSVIAYAPRMFRNAMATLYEAGHRALPLLEALDCVNRNLPFPDRSFAITFDDGYESVYSQAFPTLQRYGWSAIVFLTVGAHGDRTGSARLPALGGRDMLSWDEIREMQRGGITFGAHTLTHPDLTHLPSAQVEAEVRDSKSIIEDALSTPVTAFAYPFGRYDRRCRDIVRCHFACACADTLGLLRPQSDVHAMERVDAYYLQTERLFALMPTRWFPLYVRARALPRALRRAVQSYVAKGFSQGG
jgi:peptidoglycan/xylan/chitin deacetylase (PgdA/CDA1 family)